MYAAIGKHMAINDHSDIEKLPKEVDGIPVREVIRQRLRDPANRAPALVILHKTLSPPALFLVGLALRNLFKLK